MGKKFADEAMRFEVDLGQLFIRAIRQALVAGLAMAVRTTAAVGKPEEDSETPKGGKKKRNRGTKKGEQDSSNSAAHWTIKARGKTRTAGRAWLKLRDLRMTKTRKRTGPIGRRGDGGIHRKATIEFVRGRELKDVIDKFVAGRQPSFDFTFFNPIEESSEYGQNINLAEAGKAAVEETHRVLNLRIEAGKTRKRRL